MIKYIFICLLSFNCIINTGQCICVKYTSNIALPDYENGTIFSLTTDGKQSIFKNEKLSSDTKIIEKENDKVQFIPANRYGWPLYKNLVINEYKELKYISMKNLMTIKDSLKSIDWKITDDKIEENGLILTKAYGKFGGRIYEVYFTSQIPIFDGPYKLRGLPGLILKAKSLDNVVEFNYIEIQKNATCNFDYSFDYKTYNEKEYLALRQKTNKNLQIEAKSTPGYNVYIPKMKYTHIEILD